MVHGLRVGLQPIPARVHTTGIFTSFDRSVMRPRTCFGHAIGSSVRSRYQGFRFLSVIEGNVSANLMKKMYLFSEDFYQ